MQTRGETFTVAEIVALNPRLLPNTVSRWFPAWRRQGLPVRIVAYEPPRDGATTYTRRYGYRPDAPDVPSPGQSKHAAAQARYEERRRRREEKQLDCAADKLLNILMKGH